MILSLDISTTTIGVAIFSKEGKLAELTFHAPKKPKTTEEGAKLMTKALSFKNFLQTDLKDWIGKIDQVVIEEPLKNSKNPKTAGLLNRFNGMCSIYVLEVLGVMPEFISVIDIRKAFCPEFVTYKKGKETLSFPKKMDQKLYIFEKVRQMESDVKWKLNKNGALSDKNTDMSDAYAVGWAYMYGKR